MLIEELVAGSIDLCLSVPGMFEQSDVRWSHLLDEELLIAMSQTHRLAAKRTLNIRELSSEPFLALSPEHTLRIIFDRVCADASFLPKIAFEGMDIGRRRMHEPHGPRRSRRLREFGGRACEPTQTCQSF